MKVKKRTPEESRKLARFVHYIQATVKPYALGMGYQQEIANQRDESKWSQGLKDVKALYDLDL